MECETGLFNHMFFALVVSLTSLDHQSADCLSRAWIIDQVEAIFEQQLDAISSNDQHLSVTVKTRIPSRSSDSVTGDTKSSAAPRSRIFQFPGKHEKEAWRYSQLVVHVFFFCSDRL